MPRVPLDNFSNKWSMEILFCIWVMFHRSNKLIHVYQESDFHHSQTYTTKLIMSVDQSVSMIVGQLLVFIKNSLWTFSEGQIVTEPNFLEEFLFWEKAQDFLFLAFAKKLILPCFFFIPKWCITVFFVILQKAHIWKKLSNQ